LITEVNDLSSVVTWANVPDANITQSSVTQHQAALSVAATQLTGNITVPGNVYLAPSGTGYTELRGNTNAGAIRFNCESNSHGVTLKGPPHSATATYTLELPNADGSNGQFLKTDGSGKLSFGSVDVSTKVDENHTGDVNITGELLVDSYNETFKKVSSVSATTGYLLSSASYASKSFDFTTQTADPQAVHFNNNGTKMYTIDQNAATIYQYSLSTAYDVSTASYDSVSFSGYSQADVSYGFNFNNDGTKFYILSNTNNSVYQYSCSTAYDMSTASYDSKSFSHASQETSSTGIVFNANGTKMYIVGSSSDAIYQYTLSTAFDVSTASYDSVSLSVSSQTSQPTDLAINSDGTKMFICDNTNDSVYQYNLTTAYDLSTASYSSTSFSVTSQDTIPNGLSFSADGTKMYMVGTNTDTVYQYSVSATTYSTTFDCENANVFETVLDANTTVVFSNPPASGTPSETGFRLSSAAYDSKSFSLSSQNTLPRGLAFKTDGTKMYVSMTGNPYAVYQYSLSTAWDASTASYDNVTFSTASQDNSCLDVNFKTDGTVMYIVGDNSNTIYQYNLSTAWDLSTASYASISFSLASQETQPTGVVFKSDGTKMFIVGGTEYVHEYALSTAWNVSTASYTAETAVTEETTTASALDISADGKTMFITGFGQDKIFKYTLSTAWDITSASYDSESFSVASQENSPYAMRTGNNGTKTYVGGGQNSTIYQYSTATSSLNDSTAYAMSLKVVQDSGASGYTVTWPTSVDWPSATAPTLTATASAVDQFVFYTYDGGTNWYGFTAGQALG